ncbi:alpha/beta fold hydrolase [Planobispora takensis]|uniref:alpha/beta fold hydrolase n=1 Tax=Planobispora takensis TaxID=1367882 RepID=UPI00194213A1|nr:alpha/beta fold hydrolase [Planobispora takensis]
MGLLGLVSAVLVGAAGCGSGAEARAQVLEAAGVRQSVVCTGTGSPAVVMVHGIGDRASSGDLVPAQELLSQTHRTCRYDRPGTGQSPPPPRAGRTGDDLVAELSAVADLADPSAPVIVVAHSFGSYPALLMADRHPDRVAGLVLADTVDPGFGLLAALGAGSWKEARQGREGLDLEAVERQVGRVGSLERLPLVVVRRGEGVSQAWLAAQQALAGRSSHSKLLVAEDSGHEVPSDAPEKVREGVEALAGLGG